MRKFTRHGLRLIVAALLALGVSSPTATPLTAPTPDAAVLAMPADTPWG